MIITNLNDLKSRIFSIVLGLGLMLNLGSSKLKYGQLFWTNIDTLKRHSRLNLSLIHLYNIIIINLNDLLESDFFNS